MSLSNDIAIASRNFSRKNSRCNEHCHESLKDICFCFRLVASREMFLWLLMNAKLVRGTYLVMC